MMKEAFKRLKPAIWSAAEAAYAAAREDLTGLYLPPDLYQAVPANSIDYAIVEKLSGIAMVPAIFRWNDLGSWQSLLDVGPADADGNVIIGDVISLDCRNSYLRSRGRLLTAVGLRDVAVVATADATFVAPVSHSQNVKKIVEQLERTGRLEKRYTPAQDRVLTPGSWRRRVEHWLFEETSPLWSTTGVDTIQGGFHEALGLDGQPLAGDKRMRTMARQIYTFSVAKERGWVGPADRLIDHGISFILPNGRTDRGGWVRTLRADGTVADPAEDAYDNSFVLLALAHAHKAGHPEALQRGRATFDFLDNHLEDLRLTGFRETPEGRSIRRSNPHMHLLETFLA